MKMIDRKLIIAKLLAYYEGNADGMYWYSRAWQDIWNIYLSTGPYIHEKTIAGIVAALSPACEWELNKKQAEAICRAYQQTKKVEGITVSTYKQQYKKAIEILYCKDTSNIPDILGKRAFKTRAFYDNIIDCYQSEQVTIDRHIYRFLGMEDVWQTRKRYEEIADCFREAAKYLGIRPCQLQATIWLKFRKENK